MHFLKNKHFLESVRQELVAFNVGRKTRLPEGKREGNGLVHVLKFPRLSRSAHANL